MKTKLIVEIGVIVVAVIFVAIASWAIRERYWWRIESVKVLSGEKELSNSSVYTHRGGDLLVFLRDDETKKGIYLIKIKTGEVELPNSNQFFQFTSFLLTRYVPPHGVSIDSPKSDVASSLEVKEKEVTFTALSGEKVHLYF